MTRYSHEMWVEVGHCHRISNTKTWCHGEPGHRDAHWAPGEFRPGVVQIVYWQDKDCLPEKAA